MPQPATTAPLNEFVDWFRNDLVYKAPETWPGQLEWFFNTLVVRYGDTCPATTELLAGKHVSCIKPAGHLPPHRDPEGATWQRIPIGGEAT